MQAALDTPVLADELGQHFHLGRQTTEEVADLPLLLPLGLGDPQHHHQRLQTAPVGLAAQRTGHRSTVYSRRSLRPRLVSLVVWRAMPAGRTRASSAAVKASSTSASSFS